VALLMGIDIGTSSVKALLMDERGRQLGLAQEAYDIRVPAPGYAEQDPDQWWELACRASRAAVARAGVAADRIAAVGLSGQMHGLVALDEDGRPVRPAMIWCDQRSAAQKRKLERILPPEEMGRLVQNPAATGFQLLSLMWLRENEPDVYRRVRAVLLPKDYVRYRLTGRIGTETTDASGTSAFSVAERRWSAELLAKLELDPALFPAVSEPWQIGGTVTPAAAAEAGLSPGTPIVFGGADQAMQAVGNGIVDPGTVSCTIGTGGQLFTPIDSPVYDHELRTHTYIHAVPDRWYLLGASMSAGLSLKWLAGQVLHRGDYAALDELAANVPAGSGDLLFLPYLTGDRTPHMDPSAKGMFFGLALNHSAGHLIRAVLEGVAFSMRDSLEIFKALGVRMDRLIVSGGGARSPLWKTILADVLEADVYTSTMKEQACVGAALVAGVGTGVYESVREACRSVVRIADDPMRPNAAHRGTYARLYEVYKELYHRNRELFPRLNPEADHAE